MSTNCLRHLKVVFVSTLGRSSSLTEQREPPNSVGRANPADTNVFCPRPAVMDGDPMVTDDIQRAFSRDPCKSSHARDHVAPEEEGGGGLTPGSLNALTWLQAGVSISGTRVHF